MTALRILHVDDEPDIREVVALSLSLDSDFVIRSCSSGQEALMIVVEWLPGIALLDVMMPVMDGPTTLARMRATAATENVPVVFMTARAQTCELERFRSLGAVGVIPKPFDPMTLAASVRAFMKPADNQLGELRDVFLLRVTDDVKKLVKHWSSLKSERETPVALAGIKHIAHGLAGSGGIFGFPEISDAASALEEAVIVELGRSNSIQGIASALDRLLACVETNCTYRKVQRHSLLVR